jgi:hypothetical protein
VGTTTLYHFDLRRNVAAIVRDGFHDGDAWLSDISLLDDADPPLGDEFAQLTVEAPTDRLAEFEVRGNPLKGEGYREFRIPSAVVNSWPRQG